MNPILPDVYFYPFPDTHSPLVTALSLPTGDLLSFFAVETRTESGLQHLFYFTHRIQFLIMVHSLSKIVSDRIGVTRTLPRREGTYKWIYGTSVWTAKGIVGWPPEFVVIAGIEPAVLVVSNATLPTAYVRATNEYTRRYDRVRCLWMCRAPEFPGYPLRLA